MSRRSFNADRVFTVEEILHRINIRDRALIYAEYLQYSAALMQNIFTFHQHPEDWKLDVRIIELDLIYDEAPHLIHIDLDNWEPKGLFFGQPQTPSSDSEVER